MVKKFSWKRWLRLPLVLLYTTTLMVNCSALDSFLGKEEDNSMMEALGFIMAYNAGAEHIDIAANTNVANTGYGNTLYDDPDNKCQHCHYDTHNTWQNSMHAQSWSDPLFQLKYQDFLRFLMGKADITSQTSVTTIKGKAQVCLSCHVPGAVVSGDVKISLVAGTTATSNAHSTGGTDINNEVVIKGKDKNSANAVFSYHIGNATNRKGISCAHCHSVDTIHMTESGDTYTSLASFEYVDGTGSATTGVKTMTYSAEPQNVDMINYFSLVGPITYNDMADHSSGRIRDGRYDMKPMFASDADNTYYAGGPYYGPYGATALTSDNPNDALQDRSGLVNSNAHKYFGENSKKLCLSCHQRSASAIDPNFGGKMELCTTKHVTDNDSVATAASPNCTTCHMEKRTGIVLNPWKQEGVKHSNTGVAGLDALLTAGTFSSHEWEASNSKPKLAAGITTSLNFTTGATTATAKITNNTPHAYPGAHPMRRVILMVRAFDASGNEIAADASTTGNSSYADTTYSYGNVSTTIDWDSRVLKDFFNNINGMIADLTGAVVGSQKMGGTGTALNGDAVTTAKRRTLDVVIGSSTYNTGLTRIYGRETFTTTLISAPNNDTISEPAGSTVNGFMGNSTSDNRLMPNKTETFTVNWATSPAKVVYRVYYLKNGPRLSSADTTFTYANDGTSFIAPANFTTVVAGDSTTGWPIDGKAGTVLVSEHTAQ